MSAPRLVSNIACLSSLFALASLVIPCHAQSFVRAGQAVGKVHLGDSYDTVVRALGGKPSASDAAMGGKLWATWYDASPAARGIPPASDVKQVNVYFQREVVRGEPSGTSRVRAVQVNSPYFHTAPGTVTPGLSTLAAIELSYPDLKRVTGAFKLKQGQADYYQDTKKGIGFLIQRATPPSRGTCQAIIVFAPGSPYPPYITTT